MAARKLYEYSGRSQTLTEWAKEYGITIQIIKNRLNHGWDLERAIITPVKRLKPVYYKGKEYRSVKRFCELHGLSECSITTYMKRGLSLEQAVDRYKAQKLYIGGVHCGHNDCFTCPYKDCIEPT